MVGELQPGDPRSVGPYGLLGRLGAGGMGQVFLGRSRGGRLVAVKVIRPELAGEPGFRARFAREVAAARNVGGLFTALVIDDDAQGPVPWLATAYVAGPSLAEAVEEHGPLPLSSVLTLAAGLAESLEEIHAAGLVHLDLKPSNVLLASDGPRVIDFGISRAAEATLLTQAGTVMGSPGFMSPEQAAGGTVGPPSDVFSLGAVLVFAATGEGPFGTGSTAALLFRIVHSEPDTARLPDQIRPLVERCLAKDPALRPTSSDLLAELGAGQLAADWLPVSLAEELRRYEPATVTSPGVRQDQTDDARNGRRPGGPPRRNRRRWAWVTAIAAVLIIAAAIAFLSWPTPLPSVPSVQGDNLTAAASALKAAGFHDIPYLYDCYNC
jgi:serine/threonine protein kinase